MPNLVETVDVAKYESAKNGGPPPVSDSNCSECGEQYISIDENICEIGICVNCGHRNDISKCTRCGKLCNPEISGEVTLCDECVVYQRDYF